MPYTLENREQFFADDWPCIIREFDGMKMTRDQMELSPIADKLYKIATKFMDIIQDDQAVIADLRLQLEDLRSKVN